MTHYKSTVRWKDGDGFQNKYYYYFAFLCLQDGGMGAFLCPGLRAFVQNLFKIQKEQNLYEIDNLKPLSPKVFIYSVFESSALWLYRNIYIFLVHSSKTYPN